MSTCWFVWTITPGGWNCHIILSENVVLEYQSRLHSTQVVSTVFQTVCKIWNVEHKLISAYHPKTNRSVWDVLTMLRPKNAKQPQADKSQKIDRQYPWSGTEGCCVYWDRDEERRSGKGRVETRKSVHTRAFGRSKSKNNLARLECHYAPETTEAYGVRGALDESGGVGTCSILPPDKDPYISVQNTKYNCCCQTIFVNNFYLVEFLQPWAPSVITYGKFKLFSDWTLFCLYCSEFNF